MTSDIVITQPGIYDDIPNEVYHRDPVPEGSLSCSGAKLLLPPNCPALFRHRLEHPQPPKDAFDFGHAAHKMVLGSGPDLEVIDEDNFQTKRARDKRDAARERGAVPILQDDYDVVLAMAQAIKEHPIASALFDPATGDPEQSVFWRDARTGIMRRARFDWLPHVSGDGRMIIPDYKTCVSAAPEAIARAIASYGYHLQDDWYRDGAYALGLGTDIRFVFVFQEKTAPYLITVVEPDAVTREWADINNRHAIDIYRRCMATGYWPGYADDVISTALPRWAERAYEDAQARGDYDEKETK